MQYLSLDLGNTRGKALALDSRGQALARWEFRPGEWPEWPAVETVFLSSTGSAEATQALRDSLPAGAALHELQADTPLPYRNAYKTPLTLGADRKAALATAWGEKPGEAVLIFDLGTCLTVDYLSREGVYLGGAISPGLRMRAQALHQFTARLPEVDLSAAPVFPGQSTQESLLAGCYFGLLYEIKGWISRFAHSPGLDAVVFTGGDSPWFAAQSFDTAGKASIFADPDWVLRGLYHIFRR